MTRVRQGRALPPVRASVVVFPTRARSPRVGIDVVEGARRSIRPIGSQVMSGEDPLDQRGSSSSSRPPPDTLAPGAVVARRYELRHALGSGGMGVVWAARHLESGVLVALKFLRTGHGGADDPDSLKRFLREAR